jgi:hypothetical protein
MHRVALLLGLALAVAVARGEAAPFHASIAGACTNKDDFSFTGAPVFDGTTGASRIICHLAGNGTHGSFTATLLAETQITTTVCTQPDGASGVEALDQGGLVVLTFTAQVNQLFLKLNSGSSCLSFDTGIGVVHLTWDVIGGTGQFEGATGTIVNDFKVLSLADLALGGDGGFTNYTGTLAGSVD